MSPSLISEARPARRFAISWLLLWLILIAGFVLTWLAWDSAQQDAVHRQYLALLGGGGTLALMLIVWLLTRNHARALQIAQTLRQSSETMLRTIYDLLPTGIAITDRSGHIIDCNRASETLLGITRDEHLRRDYAGKEWAIIRADGTPMPSEEYASVRAMVEQQPVRNVEMGIVRPEGVTWLSVSAMPSTHPDYGVIIAYADITARKQAELALQELTERLQLATEAGGIGVWEWDIPNDRLIWDQQMYALYGVRESDFSGAYAAWIQGVHPDDAPEAQASIERALQGTQSFQPDFRVQWPNGAIR
jgi:PAS domain S-box-containing protein